MSNLYSELKEDLKEEKFDKFLKKAIPALVGISLIFLISVGIYAWRAKHEAKTIEQASIGYATLLEQIAKNPTGDNSELVKKYMSEAKDAESYKALAIINLANSYYKNQDYQKANIEFSKVFGGENYPEFLKNYAKIAAYYIQFDKLKLTSFLSNIDQSFKEGDLFYSQAQLLKLMALIKQNKNDEALKISENIINNINSQKNIILYAGYIKNYLQNLDKQIK